MRLIPQFSRNARLLGLALLLATFGVGGFAGFAFNHALEARELAERPASACAGRTGKHDSGLLDRLDLTAEQRSRIDAILERRRGQTHAFWEAEGARLRGIVDSTRTEIRAVLTPEQRQTYDRLREEHRARKHRAREP